MVAMNTNLRMKKMRGGLSRFLSGESIFINEFTAEGGAGEVGIAPSVSDDLMHCYLDGNIVFLQNSAFVTASMNVQVESKWQDLTKVFSDESLFLIRCCGKGDLWFNTYGAIIEITDNYLVDTW
jgi:uncharacterized protein (AIM24 family)